MIISASRRTDIPHHFSQWLLNRVRAGYCLARNPFNARQIRRVSLVPEDVDGLVLWTKNPFPLISGLESLNAYPFYFQFTLTPYGAGLEPGLPSKNDFLIPLFKKLSLRIGRERLHWRYDPIIIGAGWDVAAHANSFDSLCSQLAPYAAKVTISFLDSYKKIAKNLARLDIRSPGLEERRLLAQKLGCIAGTHKLKIVACAEEADYAAFGIGRARCIDGEHLRQQKPSLRTAKDKNQRLACGCAEAVDIGQYSSCATACVYCYAGGASPAATATRRLHDPNSPLLIGSPDDRISGALASQKSARQPSLFGLPE